MQSRFVYSLIEWHAQLSLEGLRTSLFVCPASFAALVWAAGGVLLGTRSKGQHEEGNGLRRELQDIQRERFLMQCCIEQLSNPGGKRLVPRI
jgi:hypothetical protein